MKRISISILLACAFSCLFCQDVIYKIDGTSIQSRIIEVSPSQIKYSLFATEGNPIYIIYKDDVLKIVYQDGRIESYSDKKSNDIDGKKYQYYSYRPIDTISKNYFGIDVIEFAYPNISLHYLKISSNSKMLYQFYGSLGLNSLEGKGKNEYMEGDEYNIFGPNRIFGTGISINNFPLSPLPLSFGLDLHYGQFYYSSRIPNYPYYTRISRIGNHYSGVISCGWLKNFGKMFFFFKFGSGIQYNDTYQLDSFRGRVNSQFIFGYKL